MGAGFDSRVNSLAVDAAGTVFAAGDFLNSGTQHMGAIASWGRTATSWMSLGSGVYGRANAVLSLPNGSVVVGGDFVQTVSGSVIAHHLAAYTSRGWTSVGIGADAPVWSLAPGFWPGDDFIVGGDFTSIGGVTASHLARCVDGSCFALEAGADDSVRALATTPDRRVLAGGRFVIAGSAPSAYFATRVGSAAGPSIVTQPASGEICEGESATFHVVATGGPGFRYQWLHNGAMPLSSDEGTSVSGDSTPTLRLSNAVAAECAGEYSCRVIDYCGETLTQPATLTVISLPVCMADFNIDGGIDGPDVEAFILAWTAGRCDADVNRDGGVDGADLESFFRAWAAGGC
jgi:hypothetical protein